jgi:short subunit dehydrogenase-like uncharacterized protein
MIHSLTLQWIFLFDDLGTNGFMAYLASRRDMEARHIKVSFDLGRTRLSFTVTQTESQEVIADADVVVNMIGKYYESGQPVAKDKFPVSYETNYSRRQRAHSPDSC